MIQIEFDGDGLTKKVVKMQGRVSNLRPFLKETGEYLVNQSKKQFQAGGIPKWKKPLFGGATLLKSGKLRDSVKILETTDNSVTVGTESDKRFHNKTGGYFYTMRPGQRRYLFFHLIKMGLFNKSKTGFMPGMAFVPERKFLKFQPEDITTITNKLSTYIVKD